jgi:preprotein translocase subunit SecD
MAVDANVLIFERMKEELRGGRTLMAAIDSGFNRAWPSIRDSNISTFITCAILYWFGTRLGASLVAGFAVTLFIGVVVSMFSAITISHTLLRLAGLTRLSSALDLFVPVGPVTRGGPSGAPAVRR